ncbi:hypothetical protein KAX17_15855 [Candidatus Bipolaricaulota bacterium]|nr:hypothetical protein [Candidatus Bipolaricaulota bacterium]
MRGNPGGEIKYPKTIGSAADLMFTELAPIAYLIDCLVLFDTVVVPASHSSLSSIYAHTEPHELDPLFQSGRIKYCPAMSYSAWDTDTLLSHPPFDVNDGSFDDLRSHLKEHLLDSGHADYSLWQATKDEAEAAFVAASKRKGYEWLFPPDRFGMDSRHRVVGLTTGLARINDLLVAGIPAIDLDLELATYLDICFPSTPLEDIVDDKASSRVSTRSLAESLHRIENLPPLGEMVRSGALSQAEAIRMVCSDEAAALRDWLGSHVAPGVDVRDAYYGTLRELPSKKAWTGWVRFGIVSGVSTAIASLLTANPAAGAAVGLGLGAVDQAFGGRATEALTDGYHPRQWLSYVRQAAPQQQHPADGATHRR